MFGSLKELLKTTKKLSTDSKVVQFTTPTNRMLFEICSVYVTDETDSEYIKQVFTGDEERQMFIDTLIKRNEVKAFVRSDLSPNDRFLTFSTCYGAAGTTKRLVVVALLTAVEG